MHLWIKRALFACVAAAGVFSSSAQEWIDFNPPPDRFTESAIDLRSLNERVAGEKGRVTAKGDEFALGDGKAVRFWAVNGPPNELSGEGLKTSARRLAKYGVNLARIHTPIFDKNGGADPKKIARFQEIVAAAKAEGIYTHFSIYFPLWMSPGPEHPFLKGYKGEHPFAALMFNPDFQKAYREWWRALLLTPDGNGKKLIDEPAVFGAEIQNEDSFFFWTFSPERIPDAQLRILETQFGDWLKSKHGSLEKAFATWNGLKVKRDAPEEGRVSFRPLWNIFSEKTARDKDTVEFLYGLQRRFYEETGAFLRSLGFKGMITASNWSTASPEVLGPLEKLSYAAGDFIDRHGYFSVTHEGDNAAWSIREGHAYSDRSALRFEAMAVGKPKVFNHPAMDPAYAGKPSMISETTWNRPNRFRSEAPLYFAAYGALQGTDAIVHFAYDGDRWSVKPNFWMQPWTLMAPSQMAQFPAAALMYRKALVKTGDVLARVNLNTNDLFALKGTPLPQDANFDELRLKDVPSGTEIKPGQRIDPLIHYAGRTEVNFVPGESKTELKDLSAFIDRKAQIVKSGELSLDYGKGLLTINAQKAQGASGRINNVELTDVAINAPSDNAHIIVVALDDQPLATSKRMLLQVMTEEQGTGFATEPAENGRKRITNIGKDPWQIRRIAGEVAFKTPVKAQALDYNGYPKGEPLAAGASIKLEPATIYYLLTR